MNELSSSLVALALLAVRSGNYQDACNFMVQAARLPETDDLLDSLLANNVAADVMTYSAIHSCSSSDTVTQSIEGMHKSLVSIVSEASDLYAGDELRPFSISSDDDDDDDDDDSGIDLDVLDDDDDDEDDSSDESATESKSQSSACGIVLDLS